MPGVSEKQFKDMDSRLARVLETLKLAEDRAWHRHDTRLDDHQADLRMAIRAVSRAIQSLADMYKR